MSLRLLPLLVLAGAAALASPSPRGSSSKRDSTGSNGIVRLPMRRRLASGGLALVPSRTVSIVPAETPFGPVNTTAQLTDLAYGVEIHMGEPPQKVTLAFDTGSSETWVDPYCSAYDDFLPTYGQLCRDLGIYLPQQSSSSEYLNGTGNDIVYGSGFCAIEYYKDDISFAAPGGLLDEFYLRHLQFGLATASESMQSGIMGMAHGKGFNQNYSAVIDAMCEQEMLRDKDFGVALGSVDEENGEVVFGGLDTMKFTGKLYGFPILPQLPISEDGYFRYWINLTYVGLTQPGSCQSTPLTQPGVYFGERALPDTGTSITYMPNQAFWNLLAFFPEAQINYDTGLYQVNCSRLDEGGTVDFGFGGLTVRVPWSQFIYQQPAMEETDYENMCYIGALPSNGFNILGDTFLRSAYVLFRQEAMMVYVAQYANCGSNVISSHGIPRSGIIGQCSSNYTFNASSPSSAVPANNVTTTIYPACGTAPYSTITSLQPWQSEDSSGLDHKQRRRGDYAVAFRAARAETTMTTDDEAIAATAAAKARLVMMGAYPQRHKWQSTKKERHTRKPSRRTRSIDSAAGTSATLGQPFSDNGVSEETSSVYSHLPLSGFPTPPLPSTLFPSSFPSPSSPSFPSSLPTSFSPPPFASSFSSPPLASSIPGGSTILGSISIPATASSATASDWDSSSTWTLESYPGISWPSSSYFDWSTLEGSSTPYSASVPYSSIPPYSFSSAYNVSTASAVSAASSGYSSAASSGYWNTTTTTSETVTETATMSATSELVVPILTDETVWVIMPSTTYVIVDGTTVGLPDFPETAASTVTPTTFAQPSFG